MAQLTTQRPAQKPPAGKVWSVLKVDPAALREQVRTRLAATPGRLSFYLALLTVLATLAGLSLILGSVQRTGVIDQVINRSGPLSVQTQLLYRSLSDADAAAAAEFLTSAAESPALRSRYQQDIADASAALTAVAGSADDAQRSAVGRITAALPTYTGLVETARTQNRLNFPIGAAYLREASALMRSQLLPAADELYHAEADLLADDLSSAAGLPWLTILLLLATLGGLAAAQLYLARRTQRLLNPGLATATAAALVLLVWVAVSWGSVAADLSQARRDGSAQVQLVGQARISVLQARADEALTLVARGSGDAFEQDFKQKMLLVGGADGAGGLIAQARAGAADDTQRQYLDTARDALVQWGKQHTQLRTLDNAGQYPEAVKAAVGDATAAGPLTTAFTALDRALGDSITRADQEFREQGRQAYRAGGGVLGAIGWSILIIVVIAGAVVGLRQRIAEYR